MILPRRVMSDKKQTRSTFLKCFKNNHHDEFHGETDVVKKMNIEKTMRRKGNRLVPVLCWPIFVENGQFVCLSTVFFNKLHVGPGTFSTC